MIGYLIYGSNNLNASSQFYDIVLAVLGYKRCYDGETFRTWGEDGMGQFALSEPYNKDVATAGNGTMVAFTAPSPEKVDEVYKAALAAGGTDEGAPGYRGDDGMKFYAAYFRDLDGNKLNAFCIGQ